MPRPKFIHSFARYRLEQNGIKLHHKNKRILEPVSHQTIETYNLWQYPEFETYLIKGRPLLDKEDYSENKVARSHEELTYETGLVVASRKPRVLRFKGQKTEYYLTRESPSIKPIVEIPRGHYVEFNEEEDAVMLIGPNSNPEWILYKQKKEGGLGRYGWKGETYEKQESYEELMADYLPEQIEKVEEKIYIKKDIAIGVGLDGYFKGKVVCIPEENFNPLIFVVGVRRSGKSLILTRLLDQIYHKWTKKCIVMDDPMREMDSHCLEWGQNQDLFINKLGLIGEKTRALPLVFLHPFTKSLKDLILDSTNE